MAGRAGAGRRSDRTAVNVLLTVPLGFGLAMAWARLNPTGLARACILLVLLTLSVTIEFVQGFLPGRNPSLGDVIAQGFGSVAGLWLQALFGRRVLAHFVAASALHDQQSRLRHLLQIYLVLLLLFAVMPMDLTLDVGELYGKWRSGKVVLVPFGAAWPGGVAVRV